LTLTITVPADIVVQVPNGDTGAVVNYPAPTTAGGTPPVTVVCNPPSGAFYPLGTTTVTCTATDSEQLFTLATSRLTSLFAVPTPQRSALTATGSFTITVVELPAATTTVAATTVGPTTTIDSGAIPPAPTPPPGGGLPATGSDPGDILAIAAGVLAVGCVLVAVRRRSPAG
jgi:LPXTG-motif cell wall-anchored protein